MGKSISELRQDLDLLIKLDGVARKARETSMRNLNAIAPDMAKALSDHPYMKESEQPNLEQIAAVLAQLVSHHSDEAVKVICRVFKSNNIPYRVVAILTLSEMTVPSANQAIKKRLSFWSFSDEKEKRAANEALRQPRRSSEALDERAQLELLQRVIRARREMMNAGHSLNFINELSDEHVLQWFQDQKKENTLKDADKESNEAIYSPVLHFDPDRDATKDIDQAITEARKQGKRVLIDIGGEWCAWCITMDRFFADNPDLRKLRDDNYVLVKVNYSPKNQNEAALARFPQVASFPYFFVLDANGDLLHSQRTGELELGRSYDVAKFTAFLQKWVQTEQQKPGLAEEIGTALGCLIILTIVGLIALPFIYNPRLFAPIIIAISTISYMASKRNHPLSFIFAAIIGVGAIIMLIPWIRDGF